jgi:cell division protein FtsI (penicillin-binding protein 3)
MDIKNEVLYRVYILLFGVVVPLAIALIYQTVYISYAEGEMWRAKGEQLYIEPRPIEPERGNILAADGSLLSTSIPYFDIYMDPNSTGMTTEDFEDNIDSLAYCLATYVDNSFTPGGWKAFIEQERAAGRRYVPIKSGISYSERKFIEDFPLFKLGRNRGGFIAEKRSVRKRPFGLLARRTIGYTDREDAKPVGLEGSFDEVLGGESGRQMMIQLDRSNDIWIPMDDLSLVEPKSGDDIVTTLDINIQEATQEALLRAMNYHNAEWGTAVVMEVKTGKVKAISNLGKTENGWWETYNYAVGAAVEPGSTFKTASIMALLEDGFIDLDDTIQLERGTTEFYDETMVDSSPYSAKIDSTSVRHAFEISSNVGIAKLLNKYYAKKEKINDEKGAELFIEHLRDFNLHLPTGIEIDGEAEPLIKEAYNEGQQWSGTTLPWMAIGYELRLTPLQLLTFYNAIANDGTLVKPYLMQEIQRFGETKEVIKPTIVKEEIANSTTIERVQELLDSVVTRGTAYKLKTDEYNFAGKTGTAQVGYRRTASGRTYIRGYQASFVGYFPSEAPKYSIIVVINKPRRGGFYGGDVAGPVFREIADHIYATQMELHEPINTAPKLPLATSQLPDYDAGVREDMLKVLDYLELPFYGNPDANVVTMRAKSDSLLVLNRTISENKVVPSVIGLGLRDALYILENRGLRVEVDGFGKVARQSLLPGTRAQGQTIKLFLR